VLHRVLIVTILLVISSALLTTARTHQPAGWWQVQTGGLDTNLRAVRAIRDPDSHDLVVWASGSNGAVLLSLDEGKSWRRLQVPGGETLDFRALAAFSSQIAWLVSSGEGSASRIYKTTDGGATWLKTYMGSRKEVFLDDLVCAEQNVCTALADPVEGKFLLLVTTDGAHWSEPARDLMPDAVAGEGAFAASGTSLFLSKSAARLSQSAPTAKTSPSTTETSGNLPVGWL
jgi:photosystem II stability/assembly factor-like uncharacterized protein